MENLPEDMAFGLDVRERELDLSVDTSWSNQSGSSDSILFMAMMTLMSPRVSNPSSWVKDSNMVH